ncbi:MAG: hypothetical protein HY877_00240 [Deltaproteobacteria bacterium]|nr:hypothetical protein [Deltaproteobacteria bacterium]
MMTPKDLIPTFEERFAENLESVILYGSAAGKSFIEKYSNYNLLVLIKTEMETNLLAGDKKIRQWLKKNPPPLIWDLNFFNNSIDVFPLEFLELQKHHRILFGKPLPSFEVELKNLRHQVEMELRGKYLQIKHHPSYLLGESRECIQFLMKTLPSILTLFKGVLYLSKKEPEENWKRRIERLAFLVNFHPEVFLNLVTIREDKLPLPRKAEVWEIVEAFLTELRSIIKCVNNLEAL